MHKNSVRKLNSHLSDNNVSITDTIQMLPCRETIKVYCVNYKKQIKDTIFQLDVTCFIILPFTAQQNVSTSIFRSLRLIVDLFYVLYCSGSMCVGVTVWFGWGGVLMQAEAVLQFA